MNQKTIDLFKELGFKRKWFSDKSGYWYQLKKNKYITFYADGSSERYTLSIQTSPENYVDFQYKSLNKFLESIQKTNIIL